MVKGVDLPEGKTEKDWRRWQAGMQYGIRSEQAIEKMGGHFSVVASERQPRNDSRTVSQAVPSKLINISTPRYRPLLSSIQMVDCQFRMSVYCASLYAFCN